MFLNFSGTTAADWSEVSLMDGAIAGIRRMSGISVCTLALMCVQFPAAQAQPQGASADSTAKATTPATTAKPATPTKTNAHRKAATNSSSATKKPTGTTHATSSLSRSSRKKKPVRARGQQKIDSERATSIQQALIREHYLSGEATGTWNQASEDAMRKYQADHGWQSKEVPDSRALIKLGLGPSNDHLLNPQSAMITKPDPPRSELIPTTSHTAPPTTDPAPASVPVPKTNQNDSTNPQ
jgi:hypothetical protein